MASLALPGSLHHVELNVSDLARSVAFWGPLLEGLGYVPHQTWPKGRSWRLGGTYLVFVQTEPKHAGRVYHRGGTGLNHLAFHVASPREVVEWQGRLETWGVQMLYPERGRLAGGHAHFAVFFEDPDRVKVEIVASPRLQRPAADVLLLYVAAHNEGARTGDWEPMLALFAPEAEMRFAIPDVPVFEGIAEIREAFRTRGPTSALVLRELRVESANAASARYAWADAEETAHPVLRIETHEGRIVRLETRTV